jgi:hypothetical protein
MSALQGNEIQVGQILRRQRVELQFRARKGHAPLRLDLEALRLRPHHAHHDAVRLTGFDHAIQFSVIEGYLGAGRQLGQHIGRLTDRLHRAVGAECDRAMHEPEPVAGPQPLAG